MVQKFKLRSKSADVDILNWNTVLGATVVGLLNSFFYDNIIIMGALCFAEVCILLWFLYHRDTLHYLCCYLIFLCFSMESAVFVGIDQFYGFKNFRILGVNLAVWMLFPILFRSILSFSWALNRMGKVHRSIIGKLALYTLSGIIMGAITFLSNDNGFSEKPGSLGVLFDVYYSYTLPVLELWVASYVVVKHRDQIQRIKQYLFSCIVALACVFIFCFVFKNYGNRGGISSLQVSDVYFLLCASIGMFAYPDFVGKEKKVLLISSLVIVVLSLIFNTNGKMIIIVALIPFLMVYVLIRRGTINKTIGMLLVSLLLFGGIIMIFPRIAETSLLFSIKFQQVKDMLTFSEGNWLENMHSSPRMRITEFMNIAEEYQRKPWFALFGKGFGGTIRDNLSLFNTLDEFVFSKWELQLGAYYSMHESLNCFFLIGGLAGLYYFIFISASLIKNIHKSPWLLLGFLWFLLFYNYHRTISIYGVISLVVGLNDLYIKQQSTARSR